MAPRPYFHPWLAALILFPLLSEAQQGAKCNELNACSSGCCGSQGKLHLSYSFTVEAEQLKLHMYLPTKMLCQEHAVLDRNSVEMGEYYETFRGIV